MLTCNQSNNGYWQLLYDTITCIRDWYIYYGVQPPHTLLHVHVNACVQCIGTEKRLHMCCACMHTHIACSILLVCNLFLVHVHVHLRIFVSFPPIHALWDVGLKFAVVLWSWTLMASGVCFPAHSLRALRYIYTGVCELAVYIVLRMLYM